MRNVVSSCVTFANVYRFFVVLPLILLCGAVIAAAILAYGTDPRLADYSHGVQWIMFSRRWEWPLVIVCLLLCGGLIALVIGGRRRAWWLIGLGIVVALFIRAFSSVYRPAIAMIESPPFVDADRAGSILAPGEFVAAFTFAGAKYALPYRQLTSHPLILLSDQERRAVVMWSATANAATVLPIDRTVVPREWEFVCFPADSMLLYDRRLGQFIAGVTGRTIRGERVAGASDPVATENVPFTQWVAEHPGTRVMAMNFNPAAATVPMNPCSHVATAMVNGDSTVAILATTQPAAVGESISGEFENALAGNTRALLVRTAPTAPLRAFDRQTKDDLFLTFRSLKRPDKKHPTAAMTDGDTNSLWTLDGHAIDGPLKGTQLREIGVRDGLRWGVMKFWMPELQWIGNK